MAEQPPRPRTVDLDSRARTHLANERTFLAWLRTGLAMLTLGLAAAQFLGDPAVDGIPLVFPLSFGLVVGGMLMSTIGGVRFGDARRRIEAGTYLPSAGSEVAAVAVVVAIGVIALVMVFALRPPG